MAEYDAGNSAVKANDRLGPEARTYCNAAEARDSMGVFRSSGRGSAGAARDADAPRQTSRRPGAWWCRAWCSPRSHCSARSGTCSGSRSRRSPRCRTRCGPPWFAPQAFLLTRRAGELLILGMILGMIVGAIVGFWTIPVSGRVEPARGVGSSPRSGATAPARPRAGR